MQEKLATDIVDDLAARAKSLWLAQLAAKGAVPEDGSLPEDAEQFLAILVPALARAVQGKALLRAAIIVEQAMANGDIMREGHPIAWLHREAMSETAAALKAMKPVREAIAAL
ncbi:MAG TPA: hypothetical protein VHZ78_05205 [Rhizomicrobium sp.]|jgi:hypothetical protein|nr:hypothetical protein [Rhizomicrobium sp.]